MITTIIGWFKNHFFKMAHVEEVTTVTAFKGQELEYKKDILRLSYQGKAYIVESQGVGMHKVGEMVRIKQPYPDPAYPIQLVN